MTEIKEKSLKEDICFIKEYLVNNGLITYISNGFFKKQSFLVETVEIKEQWNDIYYLNNLLIKTYLGYWQRKIYGIVIISTINLLYSPLQELKIELKIFNIEKYKVLSELYIKLKFKTLKSILQNVNKVNIISDPTYLNPPKSVYTNDIYKQYRNEFSYIDYGIEKGNQEMNGTVRLSMSSSFKLSFKERSLTSSERLWHIIIKKTLERIFRKITSEMFKVKTYAEIKVSHKIYSNTLSNFKKLSNEFIKSNSEDTPSYTTTEKSLSPSDKVIKLNSVELLEEKLHNLDLRNPQIQQCKNIFEMKKAMKNKILKDSEESTNLKVGPSYFSNENIDIMLKNQCENFERRYVTMNTPDQSSVSTIKNIDNNKNQEIPFSETSYFKDIFEEYCNKSPKKRKECLNKMTVENYTKEISHLYCKDIPDLPVKSKFLERTESGSDSIKSNRLSFSGDQNRYFKTSRRSITEELMDEVCQKDEKFNMKTLRQKAAACILYSKVNVLDRHRKASDHIDRFFDSDNKILNKTYRCLECRAIFKLGTELRQHLRTHASPQTVVLS